MPKTGYISDPYTAAKHLVSTPSKQQTKCITIKKKRQLSQQFQQHTSGTKRIGGTLNINVRVHAQALAGEKEGKQLPPESLTSLPSSLMF